MCWGSPDYPCACSADEDIYYEAERRRRELLKLEARFTRPGVARALRAMRVRR